MALTVRNDPDKPAGGHAVLDGLDGVSSLSFENLYSGLFLGADGRWAKKPHAFAVKPVPGEPGSVRLGPDIVDAIPVDSQIALRGGDGCELGRLIWADIVPSRSRSAPAPSRPAADHPAPEIIEPEPAEPPPASVPQAEAAGVVQGSRAPPRLWIVAAVVATLVAGSAAYGLLRMGRTSDKACEAFAHPAAVLDEKSDDERVAFATRALAAGCGTDAFKALDAADWQASEAAAWYLARFYDPNETAPVFRQAAAVHPDWAAVYYANWAARSQRQAAALQLLCGRAFDSDASKKTSCPP